MGWNCLDLSTPKFQRCNRWRLGINKLFHPILYWVYDYLSMQGLKFIHVSKRGHGDSPVLVKSRRLIWKSDTRSWNPRHAGTTGAFGTELPRMIKAAKAALYIELLGETCRCVSIHCPILSHFLLALEHYRLDLTLDEDKIRKGPAHHRQS